MIDNHINNPKSIKFYVKKYLESSKDELNNKVILDIPAGNGATTKLLLNLGAKAEPFDLFPEYFMLENVTCKRADISEKIPVADHYADMVICQEGIEHISDQLNTFKEFNRVLKNGGKLLITTPSYSSLSAKLSYLLFESESRKQMPPNEADDIWMPDNSGTGKIYYGHIFMIGLQKLRVLGKLAGFKINDNKYVRLSIGSLFLFPFFYPFIFTHSLVNYYRNLRKDKTLKTGIRKRIYKEQLRMNLRPRNLVNKHTFVVFEKEEEADSVDFRSEDVIKQFDKIM